MYFGVNKFQNYLAPIVAALERGIQEGYWASTLSFISNEVCRGFLPSFSFKGIYYTIYFCYTYMQHWPHRGHMYQASPCVTYCGVCSAITPKYISQCVSFTNFYPIYLDDTYLSKMSCHHKLKMQKIYKIRVTIIMQQI